MRNALINEIFKAAQENKNIIILSADLGYGVLDIFAKELPNQYINVGIAEQNMIGIAAGLALQGKKVFCYSIVPFITMRCYEQIRIDICYQNLDVTLIGTGAGFAYGTLGPTHYGIEDINIMNGLPNMKIISIADINDVINSSKYIISSVGPKYVRLNRWGELLDFNKSGNEFEEISKITSGGDIVLITSGNILEEVFNVHKILLKLGYNSTILNVKLIKPINQNLILENLIDKKYVFSIEEHTINGGLGSIIGLIISQSNLNIKFKIFGINDSFQKYTGDQKYMREKEGLSSATIAKYIYKILKSHENV